MQKSRVIKHKYRRPGILPTICPIKYDFVAMVESFIKGLPVFFGGGQTCFRERDTGEASLLPYHSSPLIVDC